ncbi:MAG: DNA replication and repair protein RecF, partial [Actinobacteria bacterium]|nr:DNA replication and repair protein RecF [Actinomycetota bacterium]
MRLTDFRNYPEATAEFGPGFNLVIGGNAQGKTSLLEAVYCLSALGSHRSSSSGPMIRHDQQVAYVKATGTIASTTVDVDAQLTRGAGMKVWINKQRVGRSGKERSLAAVLFSPEDLELIKGGPELRRRYLDHAAGRAKPVSNADRLALEKALRQRNGVLKAARSNDRALRQLDVWNQQVAHAGAAVFDHRRWVLQRLGPAITNRYGQLAEGQQPRLSYQSEWAREVTDRADAERQLLRALEENQRRDLETTTTSAGPHRDDLAIELGGAASRWYASQGEQRSLSLAMRL